MNQYATMIRNLKSPEVMERLMHLYGRRDGMLVEQTGRYIGLLKRHEELFHENREVLMISAPGRTEIGGNHTDHNRGRVLAAAINLDTLSAVSARDDMMVEIHSDGYPAIKVDLGNLDVVEKEKGKTHALVRGVAARMAELGYKIGGFNAAVTSNVMSGSGLSSSAAFEVMTCAIFDALYNGFTIDYKTRAKISQYAENVYFGKPSGLLDQMASSAGGLVTVDFKHDDPDVRPMHFDFAKYGYSLVVVATGGNHADLTDDYAAIPAEMKKVAALFNEPYLRRVRPEEFYQALPTLRGKVSDRALLRAMHFFEEDERVIRQVAALDRPVRVPVGNHLLRSVVVYVFAKRLCEPEGSEPVACAGDGGTHDAGQGRRVARARRRICRYDAELCAGQAAESVHRDDGGYVRGALLQCAGYSSGRRCRAAAGIMK
mgnify:CR=1 FL=1